MDSTCDLLHNGGVERSVAPMAAQISPKTGFVANLEFKIVLLEFNRIGIYVCIYIYIYIYIYMSHKYNSFLHNEGFCPTAPNMHLFAQSSYYLYSPLDHMSVVAELADLHEGSSG